jgi:hypothetical protein
MRLPPFCRRPLIGAAALACAAALSPAAAFAAITSPTATAKASAVPSGFEPASASSLSSATGFASSSGRERAGGSPTKTFIYRAFTASGKPAIHVTMTVRGFCWEGSLATARNDAWRCLSGDYLFDPCFSSSKAKGIVLCVPVPWTRSGVKIKLTRPLPKPYAGKPSTKGLPWGIKTTSGLSCVLATGGTAAIRNVRANYGCDNSEEWLWGSPSRKSEPWTIYIAPMNAKKLSARVKVAVAWF